MTSCLLVSAGIAAQPEGVRAAANIISNSTFDSSAYDWAIYTESGGSATLSTENGKLAMKISNVGSVTYAAQLYYDIVPLYQNGVYHLSYEISCSQNRFVEAMLQQNGGTYQAYTWKGLDLTSTPQKVDYTFTMTADTDIMAKFVFNCGKQEKDSALQQHTIYLDNVVLELVDDSGVKYDSFMPYEPSIMTDQVGYRPNGQKIAVFRDVTSETSFSVVNATTKQTVYTGDLYGKTQNSSANETDYLGDFSSVTTPGTYYITCGNLDPSYSFVIDDTVYDKMLDDSIRMLYLQRCGTAVQDSKFGHVACHNSMATVYGTSQKIDVSGGWHDAGDYGRYIVPAAKSIADLLFAYQKNPSLYSDSIGIPESGNGVPDILDEVRFELEWMLKMQAQNGGVYHKVSCASFPGYIMPENETDELIVTPVSTTATADFCASMAMAYEFYKDIDGGFAQTCLDAAKKAWGFLQQNPNFIFQNPAGIVTGEYGDKTDADERYWAAAQMYRATGDAAYLNALQSMGAKTGLDWATVGDYGNIALVTMNGIDTNSNVYSNAKSALLRQADSFATASKNSPYGVSINDFNWGSNMTVANAGIVLAVAYDLTGDTKYFDTAEANLHYLLGRNPNATCYVTGYGTVAPKNPHHRPSMAKNEAMIGMLVGGVNSDLEDSAAKAYLSSAPPAKCYVDNWESYSTNEITIYWNSPLTYLLALTAEAEPPVVPPVDPPVSNVTPGDVNCDGVIKIDDVVLMNRYIGEDTSIQITSDGVRNANCDGKPNVNADDASHLLSYLAGLINADQLIPAE